MFRLLRRSSPFWAALVLFLISLAPSTSHAQCASTTVADVVALDQPHMYNRLGSINPIGMMFALRRDIVPIDPALGIVAGNVQLRADRRPRPLVLRVNAGNCLQILFENLLAPMAPPILGAPATRTAGVHVMGMQLSGGIASDGSNVGANASSLVTPGGTATYTLLAEREGTFLLYSTAANTGGFGDGGQLSAGLFGAVNVEPPGAEYYRSQVTRADLALATAGTTPLGQPIIRYDAVYPVGHPYAGLPILRMTQGNEIVHSDLNAIITGANRGSFTTYRVNAVYPDRNQPFRELTVIFHDETPAAQAFPQFADPVLGTTLASVADEVAINYGSAGIGNAVLANRMGVGPMYNCTECKYEEFFLTSWAVGDPAMLVDVPANATDAAGNIYPGPKATRVLFPDDPSNVHHSYLNDQVKFRNLAAGVEEHHIFHLHAHQWLHTPDDDNSTYLDSQAIGPGAGYTYEITYHGSGNRNKTAGDSIYHCHFYPHFASGMWGLWRVHDVFESGTLMNPDGTVAAGARALPDAEIAGGTPIPAVVPIPGLAMAPMPEQVQIVNGQTEVLGNGNPGYPFFIPGVAGHRPPKPLLDTVDDGGLPRHVIIDGSATSTVNRFDFSKVIDTAVAYELPEDGTAAEKAAMAFHSGRNRASYRPDGTTATFVTNGLPATAGAPFADPCVSDTGAATGKARTYQAAAIQLDMKINKAGWGMCRRAACSPCGATWPPFRTAADRPSRSSCAATAAIASPTTTPISLPITTSRTTSRCARRPISSASTSTW